MEIEVGEYIRTDKGNIGRVIEIRLGKLFKGIDDDEIPLLKNIYELDIKQWTTDKYITKHSKNIIDLIEVGDYVNGVKVDKITKNYITVGGNTLGIKNLKGINSVVTKEQFDNIKYEVE